MLIPEALEVRAQFKKPFRSRPVEPLRTVATFTDQPGVFEHPEVLRDGGTADAEIRGDAPGVQFAFGHQREDGATVRLGQGTKNGVHCGII